MLDEKTIKEIQDRYSKGETKTSIAKVVGCSYPTVKKYCENILIKDPMINQKFGKLLVLSKAEKDPNLVSRCQRYKCRCDCGREVIVNGNSLRTKHTTSCGCSRKGKNRKDLIKQRFGHLVVIEYAFTNGARRAVWKCKCDCGNILLVESHLLLNGHIISCGCQKESMGEEKVRKILNKLNISYQTQYKFSDCRYKKELPFDFAIFDKDKLFCLIEYQGDIHYKSTGGWNNETSFQERQKRDNIKKEYCQKKGIKLILIPYTDYDIIDEKYLREKIYD